jgi:hypothetical protein
MLAEIFMVGWKRAADKQYRKRVQATATAGKSSGAADLTQVHVDQ